MLPTIPDFLFIISVVCGHPFTCTFNFVGPTAIQFNRSIRNTPYPFETCIVKPSKPLHCAPFRIPDDETNRPTK